MTFRITEAALSTDIGQILGNELRARYGDRSSPVKRLARDLGVSEPTARGMFGGKLPATGTFLLAAKLLGSSAARRLFASFVGDMPEACEFEELKAIRARLDRVLPLIEGRANGAIGQDAGSVPLATAAAQEQAGRGSGGSDRGTVGLAAVPSIAIVSTRRALDATRESAALRRVLNVFRPGQIALDAALEYASHDPWTGVAWKDPGNDWLVRPAANNRLCGGETDARPLSRFPDHDYAERVRIGFAEAVASAEPVAFEHVGGIIRNGALTSIHANVVRIGGADKGGREIVIATHERLAA